MERTTNQNSKFTIAINKLLTAEDPLIGLPLVINLEKDKQRLEDLQNHLQQWNLSAERYPAISGVTIPSISPHMLESKHAVNLNLTHAAVSRHCLLNTSRSYWLVLEDDCRFVVNPQLVVANILKNLDGKDWSVVSLGCFSHEHQGHRPDPAGGYENTTLERPKGWFPWGTHAYLINRKYAKNLVESWSALWYPADHLLLKEYTEERGYLLRPSVAYQEEYISYQGNGFGYNETKKTADLHPDLIAKILVHKS